MKLSDMSVRAFISKATPGNKLADGGGLHLFVTAAGGTPWRIKYRVDCKEKLYLIDTPRCVHADLFLTHGGAAKYLD